MAAVAQETVGRDGARPVASDNQPSMPGVAPIAVECSRDPRILAVLQWVTGGALGYLTDAMQLDSRLRELSQARQFRDAPNAAALLEIPSGSRALVAPVVAAVQTVLDLGIARLLEIRDRTDRFVESAQLPAVVSDRESARNAASFMEPWIHLQEVSMTFAERAQLSRVVRDEVSEYNKWVERYSEDQRHIAEVRAVLHKLSTARATLLEACSGSQHAALNWQPSAINDDSSELQRLGASVIDTIDQISSQAMSECVRQWSGSQMASRESSEVETLAVSELGEREVRILSDVIAGPVRDLERLLKIWKACTAVLDAVKATPFSAADEVDQMDIKEFRRYYDAFGTVVQELFSKYVRYGTDHYSGLPAVRPSTSDLETAPEPDEALLSRLETLLLMAQRNEDAWWSVSKLRNIWQMSALTTAIFLGSSNVLLRDLFDFGYRDVKTLRGDFVKGARSLAHLFSLWGRTEDGAETLDRWEQRIRDSLSGLGSAMGNALSLLAGFVESESTGDAMTADQINKLERFQNAAVELNDIIFYQMQVPSLFARLEVSGERRTAYPQYSALQDAHSKAARERIEQAFNLVISGDDQRKLVGLPAAVARLRNGEESVEVTKLIEFVDAWIALQKHSEEIVKSAFNSTASFLYVSYVLDPLVSAAVATKGSGTWTSFVDGVATIVFSRLGPWGTNPSSNAGREDRESVVRELSQMAPIVTEMAEIIRQDALMSGAGSFDPETNIQAGIRLQQLEQQLRTPSQGVS